MRKLALVLALVGASAWTHGSTQQVHSIHWGEEKSAQALVFMISGRVLKVRTERQDLLGALKVALATQSSVDVVINKKREIQRLMLVRRESTPSLFKEESVKVMNEDQASILPSYSTTKKLFKTFRRGHNGHSQCYDRAHVWAYEASKNHGLNLKKIFLFFTLKYIQRYDYEWWFHVAPMVFTQEGDEVTEYVLDRTYTRRPHDVGDWTNLFVSPHSICPEVNNYTDYFNHQNEQYCYVIKMSKYYYRPLDIEALERQNAIKDFWFDWEIRDAYQLGFGVNP